jgi:hypothetical protein
LERDNPGNYAVFWGHSTSLYAGFDMSIPAKELGKGVHRISVVVSAKNRKSLLETGLYGKVEVK